MSNQASLRICKLKLVQESDSDIARRVISCSESNSKTEGSTFSNDEPEAESTIVRIVRQSSSSPAIVFIIAINCPNSSLGSRGTSSVCPDPPERVNENNCPPCPAPSQERSSGINRRSVDKLRWKFLSRSLDRVTSAQRSCAIPMSEGMFFSPFSKLNASLQKPSIFCVLVTC